MLTIKLMTVINLSLTVSKMPSKVLFMLNPELEHFCEHCSYKRLVAVKMINVNALPKSVAAKFLPRELLFTQIVWHPHIARVSL